MKYEKTAFLLCGVLCASVAFAGCGAFDDGNTSGGQTFAQIAARNALKELDDAKQAKTEFELAFESDAGEALFEASGDLVFHQRADSLAWGAEIVYGDETEKEKLFATNGGVGALNETLSVYEPVDMMPVTVSSFSALFENLLTSAVGAALTGDGTFNERLMAYLETNGVRKDNKIGFAASSAQTTIAQVLFDTFGGEGTATVSRTELSVELEKKSGVSALGFSCEFSLLGADETTTLLGRNASLTSAANCSFSVELTGFSDKAAQLPDLDTVIYPLYSKSFAPVLGEEMKTSAVEISLRNATGGGYEYLLKLTARKKGTEYAYTFVAPAQKTEPTELSAKIESYMVGGADYTDYAVEYYGSDVLSLPIDCEEGKADFSVLDFGIAFLGEMWTIKTSNADATLARFEIATERRGDEDYFVFTLKMKWRDTAWHYKFAAKKTADPIDSLNATVEYYRRTDGEGEYDMTTDLKESERTIEMLFDRTTKTLDLSKLKLPSTWSRPM